MVQVTLLILFKISSWPFALLVCRSRRKSLISIRLEHREGLKLILHEAVEQTNEQTKKLKRDPSLCISVAVAIYLKLSLSLFCVCVCVCDCYSMVVVCFLLLLLSSYWCVS